MQSRRANLPAGSPGIHLLIGQPSVCWPSGEAQPIPSCPGNISLQYHRCLHASGAGIRNGNTLQSGALLQPGMCLHGVGISDSVVLLPWCMAGYERRSQSACGGRSHSEKHAAGLPCCMAGHEVKIQLHKEPSHLMSLLRPCLSAWPDVRQECKAHAECNSRS